MNVWLSNVYREFIYEMGKTNFLADSGGSILIVGSLVSLFWYLGVKITRSYPLDILFILLVYEFAEVASILIPSIGTFDWQDMLAFCFGALLIWMYYLASGSPSKESELITMVP